MKLCNLESEISATSGIICGFSATSPPLWGFSRCVTSSSDLNLKMSETEELEDLGAVALPGTFSQQPVYSFHKVVFF